MSANGKRTPPRPRIEVVRGAASEEESAAIAAALERFLADTAPEPADVEQSRWQRAALSDGVMRDPGIEPWGRPRL